MIKYVVFDFDGTIADSRKLFLSTYNEIARKKNYRLIQEETLAELQKMSIPERCRHLNVPLIRVPKMGYDFLKIYRHSIAEVEIIAGIKDLLLSLGNAGYKLGIISSNNRDTIREFLDRNQINNIEAIVCSTNILGKSRILKRFLKDFNLRPDEMIYVGDEQRDILACRALNVKIVAVTWGYDAYEALERLHPDYLATSPEAVTRLLEIS